MTRELQGLLYVDCSGRICIIWPNMTAAEAKKQIEKLKKTINHHDYRYYVLNEPEITDLEYDRLYRKLVDLEKQYPGLVSADSPTRRVGGKPLTGFEPVDHKVPMLSLDNTYSEEELRDFNRRVTKLLAGRTPVYEVSLKVDGVAVSMVYEQGMFVLGSTRGDGIRGDDVTQNLKTIRSLPLKLATDEKDLKDIEVRGEVFLPKKSFERINEEKERAQEPVFANPRNAAAGTLKLLDPAEVAKRGLDLYVHSVPRRPGPRYESHAATLGALHRAGLKIIPSLKTFEDIDQVVRHIAHWQDRRAALAYEVDGIVVKIDRFEDREAIGSTAKSPRWAIAYKYPALKTVTRLLDIQLQVGRTGRITPVAVLAPVELSGSTIARATLHNEDEIKRLDIRINDYVTVEKAGEVIPKVVAVVREKRTGAERPYRFADRCPVCREPIFRRAQEVDWRCVNASCPAQVKGSVGHFVSRGAMDIAGFGYVLVDKLVDMGKIKSFGDIYRLDFDFLKNLDRMGEKSAQNLVNAIDRSRAREFINVLYGLGIPEVGISGAGLLVGEFGNIDDIIAADSERLAKIKGIGPSIAESVVNYFRSEKNIRVVGDLRKAGLRFSTTTSKAGADRLAGKTFVFTGELSSLTREDAQALVRARGGIPRQSVSKKTDYVVSGSGAGAKYGAAKNLGVKIISEAEFLRLIKEKKNERR